MAVFGAEARTPLRDSLEFSFSFLKIAKGGSYLSYRSTRAESSPITAEIANTNDTTSISWGKIEAPATKSSETQNPVHQLQVIRYPILVIGEYFDQIQLRKPSAIASVVIKCVILYAPRARIMKFTAVISIIHP